MDFSPFNKLSQDSIHQIFSSLPLHQITVCKSVCKSLNHILSSDPFLTLLADSPPPRLLALRPPHHHHRHHPSSLSSLDVYHPDLERWLRFDLTFLPFRFLHPVGSNSGLIFIWGEPLNCMDPVKSLVVCNPLTRVFKVLPRLGSAWSRHGAVLVDDGNRVMVITQLAALYLHNTAATAWINFSSNLSAKPRSPVLVSDSVFALCDAGSPWRSQWKLFACDFSVHGGAASSKCRSWVCLERHHWADIFDVIKGPRLVRGKGNSLLMIGGLKSTFALNPSCSTILILRLDLDRMEWDEASRMPLDMYRCFQESSKLKVFGCGDRVCFSAKRLGKLALWDDSYRVENGCQNLVWRWIDKVPGTSDGLSRGFMFDAMVNSIP